MSLGFTCFRWKKNVLCKKLFDVPLVDYGVDGIGEIFQPSELSQLSRISNFSGSPSSSSSSNSLGSPILSGLWALWALPTLWWLNWKSSKSPKPRKNGRSERLGRAGRAGRSIEIGDLRELGELGELEEPCPQSVLLPIYHIWPLECESLINKLKIVMPRNFQSTWMIWHSKPKLCWYLFYPTNSTQPKFCFFGGKNCTDGILPKQSSGLHWIEMRCNEGPFLWLSSRCMNFKETPSMWIEKQYFPSGRNLPIYFSEVDIKNLHFPSKTC